MSLGIDFGTTNSAVAVIDGQGSARLAHFRGNGRTSDTFRSILYFDPKPVPGAESVFAGPLAIERYRQALHKGRFLQSLKAYLGDKNFTGTVIGGRHRTLPELIALILQRLLRAAADDLGTLPTRAVIGRPVHFTVGRNAAEDALALERMREALKLAGITDPQFEYEPIAAAYAYQQRLTKPATVLIGDFGGGTSDFSIVRFSLGKEGLRAIPMAKTGVGLAGDRFDFRIIDHVVSPKLGKGSRYKSFDKMLDFPTHYFTNFAAWHQLAIMKAGPTLRELRQLAKASDAPDEIEMLITIIEEDLGYPLYKAVSEAKLALSHEEQAQLSFNSEGIVIEAMIERADFERWIEPDLLRIDRAVEAALEQAGLAAGEIDKVFLTGGTSFVPAVRAQFEDRFGAAKIETGDQLVSIAYGLSLIGREADIARWAV